MVFIVLFILASLPANAWIVEQHVTQNKEAISRTLSSPITQEILLYEDYYHLADILTDISVIYYFTIDQEADEGFFDKVFKIFTFRIGTAYRATHSANACIRALSISETQKERVMSYGVCSHLTQDTVAHNIGVPQALKKSKIFVNGMLHSFKEIHDKDMMSSHADMVYSRQILDLAYEEDVMSFFEKVFVDDPALSQVDIRGMIDFFATQVQGNSDYELGFKGFFALPTYIYWVIVLFLFLSLSMIAFTIRLMRDGDFRVSVWFTLVFSVGLLALVGSAIWGLFSGAIWRIWEAIGTFLFSPYMYLLGLFLIGLGFMLAWSWIMDKQKWAHLATIFVVGFIILIGGWMMTLPSTLDTGNEEALHEQSIQNTMNLLNNGVNSVRLIDDPVGYVALKDADASGATTRRLFMFSILGLFGAITYLTFWNPFDKKRKKRLTGYNG